MSFPKYTIIQHFFFAKNKTKIQTICVKIINKDKVLCIPAPTDRCLGRKTKPKTTNKQNNGSYNGDNNMQLIYFTALICISPKNYKPQSNPHPSPTPIQSLNICQLIQNISLALSLCLCELAEGGDVNHTGRGGSKKKNTLSPTPVYP